MDWIALSVVDPAERAGDSLRNARDVAVDVASPERRKNNGDRLQYDQTYDRIRAKSARKVLRPIVKLPHNCTVYDSLSACQ